MGDTAKQCSLGLFQDSDFAGDLEDSKSTSGGTLCVFGSHTFVPISGMCKKQTAVSHSSTESEIISLDTGLRLDGLPALELLDPIVSVLGNVSRVSDRSGQPENDIHKRHKSQKKIDMMEDNDSVPSNVQSARQEALLHVFEDNEAAIKMIIKGRSPTMRHVSRTHTVALDWLFDRINLDGQGDGVPKAGPEQATADSRGSRTCVCAITFMIRGGTRRRGRMNQHPAVVPSSRRGKNLQ